MTLSKKSQLIRDTFLSNDPLVGMWSWIIAAWIVCFITWGYHAIFIGTKLDYGIYVGVAIFLGFAGIGIIQAVRNRNN